MKLNSAGFSPPPDKNIQNVKNLERAAAQLEPPASTPAQEATPVPAPPQDTARPGHFPKSFDPSQVYLCVARPDDETQVFACVSRPDDETQIFACVARPGEQDTQVFPCSATVEGDDVFQCRLDIDPEQLRPQPPDCAPFPGGPDAEIFPCSATLEPAPARPEKPEIFGCPSKPEGSINIYKCTAPVKPGLDDSLIKGTFPNPQEEREAPSLDDSLIKGTFPDRPGRGQPPVLDGPGIYKCTAPIGPRPGGKPPVLEGPGIYKCTAPINPVPGGKPPVLDDPDIYKCTAPIKPRSGQD